jgi:hypothetical protein
MGHKPEDLTDHEEYRSQKVKDKNTCRTILADKHIVMGIGGWY